MFYVLMGVLAFVGGYAILTFYYMAYGGVYTAVLWASHGIRGVKEEVRKETLLSLDSIPAMVVESESVFDYVAKLGNEHKREAYSVLLTELRAIVLEVSKHPAIYPAAGKFCATQLKSLIRKSSVAKCMETAKFRVEAEMFIVTELMRLDEAAGRLSYDTSRYNFRSP